VKQHLSGRFTHLVGVTTGLYTAALIGGAAVASAISAPLADSGAGWRGALLVWAAPALLAAVAWSVLVRRPAGVGVPVEGNVQQNIQPGTRDGVREDGRARPTVTRSWVTWALAVFMGTQSLAYFAVLAWLPALLRDNGIDAQQAGLALSLFNLLGIATALVTPTLAGRMTDQRPLALSVCGLWAIGAVGLLVDPGLYLVWSVLAGLAQGAAISLALALIVLRARTPEVARQLSGTVQSVGYLIGAAGPLALGALRDATKGWSASLVALLAAVTLMAIGAWGAGQNKVVG
jgi:CP family cyanate transporter-like MFS transporter